MPDIIENFPELKNASHRNDIIPVMRFIALYIYYKKFNEIDNILDDLKVEELTMLAMVSIIRITYSARNDLQNWNSCLYKIRVELDKRGEETFRLLKGLI